MEIFKCLCKGALLAALLVGVTLAAVPNNSKVTEPKTPYHQVLNRLDYVLENVLLNRRSIENMNAELEILLKEHECK